MKMSLKSKFYILVLPAVVVLVAAMVILVLPQRQIRNNVKQIDEGLAEVLPAEGFARHYERQLRKCAAFIATGSAEHERLYEDAKKEAASDIDGWIDAEVRSSGDAPTEHSEELKAYNDTRGAYRAVTEACDQTLALAASGQRGQAMADLVAAANGPSGTTVTNNINEHLPDEEAQLKP